MMLSSSASLLRWISSSDNVNSMVSGKRGRNRAVVSSTDCTGVFRETGDVPCMQGEYKDGVQGASGRIGIATASWSDKSTSPMTTRLTPGHHRLGSVALRLR